MGPGQLAYDKTASYACTISVKYSQIKQLGDLLGINRYEKIIQLPNLRQISATFLSIIHVNLYHLFNVEICSHIHISDIHFRTLVTKI